MNPLRTGVAVAVVLLAVAVIFLVPIPRGVEGLALIQVEPRAFDRVVIPDSGGFLADLRVRDGESVREGQVLAVLTNPRVQIALSANEADHRLRQDQYRARISWLSELRGSEKQAGNDLEQIKFEVESLRQQNSLLRQQARTLILRAPRSGQVFGLQLEEQQGRWLDRGTELCRVGDTQALRAVLLVAPSDHQRIHTGSAARFRVRGSADRSWIGNVLDIAQVDARSIPPQLSTHAGGEVATRQDPTTHQEQPHEQHYLVAVHLAQTGRMLHPGALGRLRIEAEPRTLAWRVRRYLALTFHWGL